MSETTFSRSLRQHLKPFGVMKRIENRIDLGTPDIAYRLSMLRKPQASGWIETKYLPAWPARVETKVCIEHFTLEQVLWLSEWAEDHGRAWLLLRVADDVLVINPAVGRLLQRRELTRAQLFEGATGHWKYVPFPVRGLLEVLTG